MAKKKTFRGDHLPALMLLLGSLLVGLVIYIGVQSFRSDPLPTLVWSPGLSDAQMMKESRLVIDRIAPGWWWIYADPKERQRVRQAGAVFALAFPTPIAQMAGCSVGEMEVRMSPP